MKKLSLLILLLGLTACAAPKTVVLNPKDFVWPAPPEQPRVVLENAVRFDKDIEPTTKEEILFGGISQGLFKKPHGIVADKRGNIYVSDTGLSRVTIVNLNPASPFKGQLSTPYGFKMPLGMAYNSELDWLAIADGLKRSVFIYKLPQQKNILTLGQKGELKKPVAVAIDSKREKIYVTDTAIHKIFVYDLQGNHLKSIGGKGAGPGQFYYPTGIAVADDGWVYVVNSFNFRFDIFDEELNFVKSIGEHGDIPGMFARPKDVTIDTEGHIYITDAAHNNFQIFDREANIYLFVGSGGGMVGQFRNIWGIYIDDNDKIHVTDQSNRRIQIFQFLSEEFVQKNPEYMKDLPGYGSWEP